MAPCLLNIAKPNHHRCYCKRSICSNIYASLSLLQFHALKLADSAVNAPYRPAVALAAGLTLYGLPKVIASASIMAYGEPIMLYMVPSNCFCGCTNAEYVAKRQDVSGRAQTAEAESSFLEACTSCTAAASEPCK